MNSTEWLYFCLEGQNVENNLPVLKSSKCSVYSLDEYMYDSNIP
jgi:hypothetical protein